jgi:hypothetical protein
MNRIWSDTKALLPGGLIALLVATSIAACGGPEAPRPNEPNLGSVGVLLQLAPGLKLDAVNYAITGPGGFATSGALNLASSNTLKAQISGLPADVGYSITLSGSTSDKMTACSGSATFAVRAGASTSVTVHLICKQPGNTGSVIVGATLNVCPVIDAVAATPSEVRVGAFLQLSASAHDADAAPASLSYAWETDSGTLSASNVANPTFTCTSFGAATLKVTVSDGDPSPDCKSSATLAVTCSAPTAYLVPTAPGVVLKDILTVGQSVNGYRMAGIPDGLGAFDNGDGTFTLLMNHELGNTAGVPRAHGGKGAFVSKWIIRKFDLAPLSGQDLMKQVALWRPATSSYDAPATGIGFSRFCSADLAPISAFYDAATGLGFNGRLFTNGEESGTEGRALAHGMDGLSWELPRLGKLSFENVVAHPNAGAKTLVAELDDSTPGQVYFYLGTKTNAGSPIEKAGLTNGTLFGVKVSGVDTENSATGILSGTAFTLVDLGNVENATGAALDAASVTAGVTRFLRPEDGAWDPVHTNDFYFVTTNAFSSPSRLWRLRFVDISNPAAGGTIDMLLDGSEGQRMFDNITIDRAGHVYLQEDVGNNAHLGKVWRYDIVNDTLTTVAQHDSLRFLAGGPLFLTQDEESSGIIDATSILGAGWFLLDVQAHYATDTETVEGGQLLAMYDPTWNTSGTSTVDLAVIGDTPYGATQIADFPNLIAAINGAPDVSYVVHVGDTKNGSSRCDDSYFASILASFQTFADPMVYSPGDNEWTDCHRANNGGYNPLERLSVIRSMFFPSVGRTLGSVKKDVLSQSVLPGFATFVENTLWSQADTVFATVHVVGSNNSLLPWYTDDPSKTDDPTSRIAEETAREAAAVAWIDEAFAKAAQQNAKGVALFMQADMWDPAIFTSGQYSGFVSIVRKLADATRAFGRPVLLVEGDSHVFKSDNPLVAGDATYGVTTPVPNLTRIVVQGSTTAPLTEWLRLKVNPATPAVFSWTRNPR